MKIRFNSPFKLISPLRLVLAVRYIPILSQHASPLPSLGSLLSDYVSEKIPWEGEFTFRSDS